MKHTNLGDEIFTMKKPKTDYRILTGVATMIAAGFIIYMVGILIIDVMPLI
jgi:hypothetical protein